MYFFFKKCSQENTESNSAEMYNVVGFVGRKTKERDKMKISTQNTDHASDNFNYDAASESHKILLEESINCLGKLDWETQNSRIVAQKCEICLQESQIERKRNWKIVKSIRLRGKGEPPGFVLVFVAQC